MKILKPKFTALALAFTLTLSTSTIFAENNDTTTTNTSYDVSINEARNVAITHIIGTMKTDPSSNWNSGVKISTAKALFDLDNNPSAYLFELEDIGKNDSGYIIVSASKNDIPIIEYSSQGKPFIDNAIEMTITNAEKNNKGKKVKRDNTKVYYLDDFTYLSEHQFDDSKKIAYDISTGDCTITNIDKIKKIKQKKNKDTQYLQAWNELNKNFKKASGSSSTPPDSGSEFITNPYQYESGYVSATSSNVTSYYQKYMMGLELGCGGVCAPTAATNICLYWYNRNYTKYKNLQITSGSWQATFDRFFTLMKTANNLTSDSNIAPAYEAYFKERGVGAFVSGLNYGTWYGDSIVTNVDRNNCPTHLILHNHYKYTDHAVVALGYVKFRYTSLGGLVNNYSTYIRIADGWTDYPTRFVWGGCSEYWNYVLPILY
ncbi:hypothetical protein [Pseudobacteroides cellulosolvens]|uniref:Peptidase C39-like domain-containing protein n=1 Tax=Pseudobacteroides cellulosolvens ATCC 35603 = DSM 2933 TaxID=398512 RepID=A0A0L6JT40_9FIRM|nr:hypothetical protein [Pseudobacteroides cellulosolvens]KNY28864.1 hypothetical protein Bccel_4138 [Pseudobacteroides cellulosolvens ATCC 35603 = DSM 2933]